MVVFDHSKYNILVVDDSKSVNNIIFKTFEKLGYNCFQTFDLAQTRELLATTKMDYIMLDINLPDGTGFDLIKELENTPEKIFVLTSENDQQLIEIAYQKGVIDFIVKDKSFFAKLNEISLEIEKLEKNREKTIVVIDDSIVIQQQIKDIFENRHYNVLSFTDPNDVLEVIADKDKRVDLILLDYELINTNGVEFIHKNKKVIFEKEHIPVMIVSGKVDFSITRDAFKAGAIDVIPKPYVIEEMVLKVELWIDYKRKEDEIEYYKNTLIEKGLL